MQLFKRQIKSKNKSSEYWYIRYQIKGKDKWESVGKVGEILKKDALKFLRLRREELSSKNEKSLNLRKPIADYKYSRDWYYKNKNKVYKYVKKDKDRNKKWYKDYKESLSCNNCGFSHPAAIYLHHKVRATKKITPSKMLSSGWSINRMKKELEKCEPLCANCHRIEHYGKQVCLESSPGGAGT